MPSVRSALLLALFSLCLCLEAAPQIGAGTATRIGDEAPSHGRKLHGRFLHITDVHADPYYKTYSSTEKEAACHRGHGPAGIYGAETSACDSPVSLVNETFKWIEENLKGTIDFVIWTGDSARHDNDENIPRNERQVVEQNELLVNKFMEVFGKEENLNDMDPTNDFTIPIVPTWGNNDILPHNIFEVGPNKWTLRYLKIWRNFIPEEQRHQFAEGGWFYVEVIPKKLVVISLNTLYFFDSNSAVDGCAAKSEPGYEHMEWLRIQLQSFRERGMKAILMGHVPPARTENKSSWDETCWQKYTLWMRQYRDIIVGSLYGHMNIEHFMLQDFKDIAKDTKAGKMDIADVRESMLDDGEISVASASDYLIDLRDAWSKLPTPPNSFLLPDYADVCEEQGSVLERVSGALFSQSEKSKKQKRSRDDKNKFFDQIGGRWGERFSVSHVSASVVPNYFPTLRIFEYNITGLEDMVITDDAPSQDVLHGQLQTPIMDDSLLSFGDVLKKKDNKENANFKKPKKYKFTVPAPPSKSSPPGPAYSPQTLSLLGYVQYFANLTRINNDFVDQPLDSVDAYDLLMAERWKEGKHRGKESKNDHPKPKKFKFEVEYNTTDDNIFKLKDLTVRSYVDLARRIGEFNGKTVEMVEEEDVFESDDEEVEDHSADTEKKKHKKKKKHGKHGKRDPKSTWFTFVKRAFVGTMDPASIEHEFGSRTWRIEDIAKERLKSPEL
ncbi:Endopolyphosphatase [Lepidopterella palustris CBS 459.81]|uniref:Endopolyphosphatase n=1 Tax=Lepidopterella palustris CBS 459.81 TaxID=1314670 RepID=A0A8E2EKY4_9PEZI|nr:Endopolyphosphatase [Lepidopterella palustris CBS 459.81]